MPLRFPLIRFDLHQVGVTGILVGTRHLADICAHEGVGRTHLKDITTLSPEIACARPWAKVVSI